MANTRSAALSVRLKPETKRRLAKLAKASGRSSNFLISDAVESYVSDQERLLAEARLREIRAYIALDKPDAVGRTATRIVAIVEALRSHPHLGRTGAEPGVRELVVGGTPYIVVYE